LNTVSQTRTKLESSKTTSKVCMKIFYFVNILFYFVLFYFFLGPHFLRQCAMCTGDCLFFLHLLNYCKISYCNFFFFFFCYLVYIGILAGPIILNQLILFFEDPEIPLYNGLFWTAGICFFSNLRHELMYSPLSFSPFLSLSPLCYSLLLPVLLATLIIRSIGGNLSLFATTRIGYQVISHNYAC
jgi:hypothetical protein